jgi:putative flippase GtrA
VLVTVLSFACLGILVGVMDLSPAWANLGVVLCLTPLSFELNRRWVWSHEASRRVLHVLPFFGFALAGIVLSTGAVHYVSRAASRMHPDGRAAAVEAASMAAWGTLWMVQFVVLDRVIFRSRPSTEHRRVSPDRGLLRDSS